eukprot:TRINITY_DN5272_c0_g1_i1.p2 TRINITY_DN5272_c0_g1~~TRINITY_DN5272_c0_g1_i1.p2  ORF type:complete len:220 (-),score=41.82 TRINITY_DN5272_c0_g1_i1:160-819(-)
MCPMGMQSVDGMCVVVQSTSAICSAYLGTELTEANAVILQQWCCGVGDLRPWCVAIEYGPSIFTLTVSPRAWLCGASALAMVLYAVLGHIVVRYCCGDTDPITLFGHFMFGFIFVVPAVGFSQWANTNTSGDNADTWMYDLAMYPAVFITTAFIYCVVIAICYRPALYPDNRSDARWLQKLLLLSLLGAMVVFAIAFTAATLRKFSTHQCVNSAMELAV